MAICSGISKGGLRDCSSGAGRNRSDRLEGENYQQPAAATSRRWATQQDATSRSTPRPQQRLAGKPRAAADEGLLPTRDCCRRGCPADEVPRDCPADEVLPTRCHPSRPAAEVPACRRGACRRGATLLVLLPTRCCLPTRCHPSRRRRGAADEVPPFSSTATRPRDRHGAVEEDPPLPHDCHGNHRLEKCRGHLCPGRMLGHKTLFSKTEDSPCPERSE